MHEWSGGDLVARSSVRRRPCPPTGKAQERHLIERATAFGHPEDSGEGHSAGETRPGKEDGAGEYLNRATTEVEYQPDEGTNAEPGAAQDNRVPTAPRMRRNE